MFVRHAVAVVVGAMVLSSSLAHAKGTGTEALALSAGSGIIIGVACWTADIIAREMEEDREPLEGDEYTRRGFFASANAVYGTHVNLESSEAASLDQSSQHVTALSQIKNLSLNHSRPGFKLRAGYRCNRRFSAEAEFEWLSPFEGRAATGDLLAVADVEIKSNIIGVNIKAHLMIDRFPITSRIQPYLLLGSGLLRVNTKITTVDGPIVESTAKSPLFVIKFGGGADYYVTKNIVVNAGIKYVLPLMESNNFKYISTFAGAEYRF